MSYIRTKKIKGIEYYYLVEGHRDKEGKVKQRVLKYFGREKPKGYKTKVKKGKKILGTTKLYEFKKINKEIEKIESKIDKLNKELRELDAESIVDEVFKARRERIFKIEELNNKRKSLISDKEKLGIKEKEISISESMKKAQKERTRRIFLTPEEKRLEYIEWLRESNTRDKALESYIFFDKIDMDGRRKWEARNEAQREKKSLSQAFAFTNGEIWEYKKKLKEEEKERKKKEKAEIEERIKEERIKRQKKMKEAGEKPRYRKDIHTMKNGRNINDLTPIYKSEKEWYNKLSYPKITHQQNIIRSFDIEEDIKEGREVWVELFHWNNNDLIYKEDRFITPTVSIEKFKSIHDGEKKIKKPFV